MQTADLPDILKVEHVQKHLNIGRKQAYQVVNRDDFPSFRPNGRSIRIHKERYMEWLERQSAVQR